MLVCRIQRYDYSNHYSAHYSSVLQIHCCSLPLTNCTLITQPSPISLVLFFLHAISTKHKRLRGLDLSSMIFPPPPPKIQQHLNQLYTTHCIGENVNDSHWLSPHCFYSYQEIKLVRFGNFFVFKINFTYTLKHKKGCVSCCVC